MAVMPAMLEAEVERLLFEDEDPQRGFMLHPDVKWDESQAKDLYCIALCHRCAHRPPSMAQCCLSTAPMYCMPREKRM